MSYYQQPVFSSFVMTRQGSIVGGYTILKVVILALLVSEDLKCQACWRRHEADKENDPSYDHKKKMKQFRRQHNDSDNLRKNWGNDADLKKKIKGFRGQLQEAHEFLGKRRHWRCPLKEVQERQMHAAKSTELRWIQCVHKRMVQFQ
jgi:hypothetical protein